MTPQDIRAAIVEQWREHIIEEEALHCRDPITLGMRVAQSMDNFKDEIEENIEKEIAAAELRRTLRDAAE
jgi:hypothetical protein